MLKFLYNALVIFFVINALLVLTGVVIWKIVKWIGKSSLERFDNLSEERKVVLLSNLAESLDKYAYNNSSRNLESGDEEQDDNEEDDVDDFEEDDSYFDD